MAKALKSKRQKKLISRIERVEGDFLVSCTPVYNRDGEVEKIIHVSTDIGNVLKSESALAEGQKRLKLAVEAANLGMWDFNPTTLTDMHCNDQWYTMLGYEPDELPPAAETWTDLLHPMIRKRYLICSMSIWPGKRSYRAEFRLRGKDGSYHWIHSLGAVVEWGDDGKPKRMIGVHLNDTERRQAEDHLRETEKRFSTIFQTNPGPMAITRISDDHLIDVNRAWQEITGYRKSEAVGRTPFDLNLWVDPDQRKNIVKRIQTDGKVKEEIKLRRRSGEIKDLLFSAEIIKLGNDKYMLSMALDVTEQKQAEAERIEMQAKLNQMQKLESLGNLAGGIAHDFNNILSSIIGFAELSLEDATKGSPIADNLQEIYSAGKRAKALVKQILAFARKSDEELNPVQPKRITKEVLAFIRSTIPTTIEIRQNINSDAWILGNSTQVYQVLMNLCTNAAQAMEDKGGVLQVSLEEIVIGKAEASIDFKQGGYIVIKVLDTGTGIAPEIRDRVFEPYFTTKATSEGTGMGLAMVHGVVESYGGKITVDSELGKGTTFTIYLPVITKQPAQKVDLQEQLPTGKERILFVDDEAPIAKMGSRMLEKFGYSVVTRTSSIEALKLFESNPHDFDLVVTDMTMPNLTGDKLAIELMKIRPDIPVILCTGYSSKISDETASEIGIKAFAYKPVVKADLAKTVRKVLDGAMD